VINFICGCTSKLEPPITEDVFKTFDAVVLDAEGFLTCLSHHERRSGWRSLPTLGSRADFSFASWTPLEIERFIFWAEFPSNPAISVRSSEDRRDNRDPEILGAEIIARRNGNELRADWPR